MNDLTRLAADLAHAAGEGSARLARKVEHGGATKAEVGVRLPGTGLIATSSVSGASASPEQIAASMAVGAAEGGARLVTGR